MKKLHTLSVYWLKETYTLAILLLMLFWNYQGNLPLSPSEQKTLHFLGMLEINPWFTSFWFRTSHEKATSVRKGIQAKLPNKKAFILRTDNWVKISNKKTLGLRRDNLASMVPLNYNYGDCTICHHEQMLWKHSSSTFPYKLRLIWDRIISERRINNTFYTFTLEWNIPS